MIFLPVVAGRIGHVWRAMLLQLDAACEQLQEARKFQKMFQELVVASPGRPLLREDGRSNKQLLKHILWPAVDRSRQCARRGSGVDPWCTNALTTAVEPRQVC